MRKYGALDALLSSTVQGILAAVLVERQEPWYMSDLAKRLGRTPSTLQRPLDSLVAAGILQKSTDGNRVYYARHLDCPILPELRGMLIKTVGLVDVLRAELAPLAKRLRVAFVYGSMARGEATSESDVDLLVVGAATLAQLAPVLKKAERRLARPVNATLFPPAEFRQKLARGNHFLRSVLDEEKLFVLGTAHDLEGLSTKRLGRRPPNQPGGAGRPARSRGAKSQRRRH